METPRFLVRFRKNLIFFLYLFSSHSGISQQVNMILNEIHYVKTTFSQKGRNENAETTFLYSLCVHYKISVSGILGPGSMFKVHYLIIFQKSLHLCCLTYLLSLSFSIPIFSCPHPDKSAMNVSITLILSLPFTQRM